MLNRVNKLIAQTFAVEKKLFVYDSGRRDLAEDSGIRATIFGATGLMGIPIAALLGKIGSRLIMPVSNKNERYLEHPKELKLAAPTHKSWVQWEADFRDERLLERMVENSNVVINLLGPRKKIKDRKDYEFINIEVPERIAKVCAKKGIHRLIHFSAAGADPNSPSLDFETKYFGEQAVKAAFPNATIFRPCTIYGQNDHFAHIILRQSLFFWHKFVLVYDDCTTKKQPIKDSDVALAVLNALKLEHTKVKIIEFKGNTYELGGPHALSMLDIHEIIFNTLNLKPSLAYVNPELAMAIAKRVYNWEFCGVDVFKKKTIAEVVTGNHGTIQDLHIDPVSFKNGIFSIMREYVFEPGLNDEDREN